MNSKSCFAVLFFIAAMFSSAQAGATSWVPLGGSGVIGYAALTYASGQAEVFTSTSGGVYHTWTIGSINPQTFQDFAYGGQANPMAPTPFQPAGVAIGAFVNPTTQNGQVIVGATDGSIWTASLADNWSTWTKIWNPASNGYIGFNFFSRFYVISNQDGRLQLFFTGEGLVDPSCIGGICKANDWGAFMMNETSPGSWTSWNLPSYYDTNYSDHVPGRNTDGRIELFVNSAGNYWHMWQGSPNGGWSAWARLGNNNAPCTFNQDPKVSINNDGRLEVFGVCNSNQAVVHTWQNCAGCGWSNWTVIRNNQGPISSISSSTRASGLTLDIAWQNTRSMDVLIQPNWTLTNSSGADTFSPTSMISVSAGSGGSRGSFGLAVYSGSPWFFANF